MKWTENGIEFEGTVEDYLAIHGKRQHKFSKRRGHEYDVIDLDGNTRHFVRQADAAKHIAKKLNTKFTPNMLSKMKVDTVNIADLIPEHELDLITRPTTQHASSQTPNKEIA